MRTLLVPNFSLPFVPDGAAEALAGTTVHYLRGDVDHGRVVAAFSVASSGRGGHGGGHPRWGTTVLGRRDFLIAANIDLADPDPALARRLAKEIRTRREAGEPAFRGVRALGFPLASRGRSQLSFNLARPDETAFEDLYAWTADRAEIVGTELIGVIRPIDLPRSTRLTVEPAQVVSVD